MPRATDVLTRVFYSGDMREALEAQVEALPQGHLELLLDASMYDASLGNSWPDLSGNNVPVNIANTNAAPVFNSGYGGYFDFQGTTKWFTVELEALNNNVDDYTVMFCGVNAAVSLFCLSVFSYLDL